MRIAILIDAFKGGGKERRCLQMIKGLNEHGIKDIHLILMEDDIDYKEIYNTTTKIHLLERKNKFDILYVTRLLKSIKEINPDIIMTWSILKISFYLSIIKPFLKSKYVCAFVTTAHPLNYFSLANFIKYISFIQSDVIVGNSVAGIKAFKAIPSKAKIIYNGFDFEREKNLASPIVTKRNIGLKTKYMISMAAAFRSHKDYRTFIEAAKIVLNRRQDVTFYCIGKGELLDETKQFVDEKYKDNIIFLGFRNDVDSLLNASDISVLCTNNLVHKEGVSNTIVESMVYKTPVIATTGGGTNEIIIDNETGIIIPPFDPDILAEKIIYLLNNDNLRQKLGEKSRQRIIECFSLEKMINEYISLFTSLLQKQS